MITGKVKSSLQGTITLELKGDEGQSEVIEALVDTGYNGYLTLPLAILQRLNAPFYNSGFATLADGSRIPVNSYLVRVVWDGTEKIVTADEAEGIPLIGMELMLDYVVTVEAWNGGQVTVTGR